MATNLNIPGNLVSSGLQSALSATGASVFVYDNSLYIEGTVEQEEAAQAVAASFDIAEGVFSDRAKHYEKAVQAHLDAGSQAAGYDSIMSACSYAGHTNPFQTEGKSFTAWRGAVWAYCYEQLALVKAGTRTAPTVEDLITELPTRA